MRVLLDTHAFLWFAAGDGRLFSRVRPLIEDAGNERFVSIATLWEISIKSALGRLEFTIPLEELFTERIQENGFALLDIRRGHLLEVARLPLAHRDPFDRLLVAQAKVEELFLLSNDVAIDAYGVRRVW